MSKARMLDFAAAYQRRHGSLPRPLLEIRRGRRTIADIALEGLEPCTLLRTEVSPRDMVVMRAGNAVFRTVFLGVDGKGILRFRSLNNRRYASEGALAPEESCTLWRGTRMDFSSFTVSMHRLTFHGGREALVELRAHFERSIEVG